VGLIVACTFSNEQQISMNKLEGIREDTAKHAVIIQSGMNCQFIQDIFPIKKLKQSECLNHLMKSAAGQC